MSNDMFPDPLVKLMQQDADGLITKQMMQGLQESRGGIEALMAKSRADALRMQEYQQNQRLHQMYQTFQIAIDEVMQDILQRSPELRKHETVLRHMAMDTNPADLKGAIAAVRLAAEHVRRKLMEEPKGIFRMLFIGGPRDGQWHALPEVLPTVKVAVFPHIGIGPGDRVPNGLPNNTPIHTEEYRLMKLGANDSNIYVHESIANSEVVDYLLAGYKGAMENKYGTD